MMNISPKLYKFLVNIYPPYLGAGVRVDAISHDWRKLQISMPLRWYNRNVVGTQFGGSLYSMVDPHLMLLLMKLLGKDYMVWDKSANIEYIKPGKTKVVAKICITDDELEKIKAETQNNKKYFANFTLEVLDTSNELVAKIEKVIYIRKKAGK
jgi:acyl-coenzyme A thioesterase PaaI-like protein